MRDYEERLALMHKRAREIEQKRIGTRLAASGGMFAALAFALFALVGIYSSPSVVAGGDAFTASSLLGDGAGGYVLAALAAFAAGIAVTLIARRSNGKAKTDKTEMKSNEERNEK